MGAVIREPDGRTFPLGNEPVTIGRSRENRLTLTNNQISSRHAEIHPLGGGRYQIVDLGSRNGTTVNGLRLTPHEARPLSPDDLIGLGGSGGVDLRFELIADAPAWGQDQFQPQPAPGGFGAPGPAAPGGPPFGGSVGHPPPGIPGFGGPPADPGFGGNVSPAFPPAAPAQGSFAQPGGPPQAPFQPAQPGGPPQAPFAPPNQFGPPPGGPPPFGAPNAAPPPAGPPFGGPPAAPPAGPPFGASPGFAPQPQGPGAFAPPQGGPGGFPPQPGFPGGPGGPPPSGIGPGPRKGKSLRTILLLAGSALVIVLIVVAVVFALTSTKGGGQTTPTPSPGPTQTPTATITAFYDNLKKQDYAAAAMLFTQDYIAMHDGPQGTAKVLQGFDTLRGKVTNYAIVASNGSGNSQTATVQVTRAGGKAFGPDQLQLTFQKSGKLWQLSAWTPGAPK
jgi:hypothetical protein